MGPYLFEYGLFASCLLAQWYGEQYADLSQYLQGYLHEHQSEHRQPIHELHHSALPANHVS